VGTYFADCLPAPPGLVDDGLIVMEEDGFALTSIGRCFVRNVCMLFDAHLPEEGQRRFSRTV
jgi:oxygen-independent coproporphyrinogen-3 oxidase